MNISDIPYNMKFTFGPNLREVPISKIQMLSGMIYIRERLNEFGEREQGKWYGLLGSYLRIVGELEESEKHLKTAINICQNTDNKHGVFANRIRLAHTYQWWTKFDLSNKMFTDLLETAESDSNYSDFLDFVYEHYGKNLFDQAEFKGALEYFKKALELRLGKDDKELILSSESAVEACEYRIENNY
ncbi:tetratricopeptide repeat protein [Virgibacillus ihumii]|uniref:tetratricopeptide repeat protein n=1 Tax=Virgibacillus ihumii TaxID=2686091 RepID=UPI001FE59316|nr:tetratricopeptide repeat protein [Virgibacillus ihumii]